jgi:hypothetical protein
LGLAVLRGIYRLRAAHLTGVRSAIGRLGSLGMVPAGKRPGALLTPYPGLESKAMNCIDAVEGTAKVLLQKFLDVSVQNRQDVSEYIREVKVVIDAVAQFLKNNPEVTVASKAIRSVLYDYAKTQWLIRLAKSVDSDTDAAMDNDLEYQAYCYDYLFTHGDYPR